MERSGDMENTPRQMLDMFNDKLAIIASESASEHPPTATDERCEVCNGELSACGEQNVDGTPSMDCRYCQLKEAHDNLKQQLAGAKKDSERLDWLNDADFTLYSEESELGSHIHLKLEDKEIKSTSIRKILDKVMNKEK